MKTLVTLAIAAVACTSIAAAQDVTIEATRGGNLWASSFTLNFELSEALDLSTATVIGAYSGSAPTDSAGANVFTIKSKGNDQYEMIVGQGALTWDAATQSSTTFSHTGQRYTRTVTLSTGTVYTLVGTGSTENNSITVELKQGDTVVQTFGTYSGGMNGSQDTLTTYYDARFTPTAAPVPEPATATLSLLALAGLAARRRRK